MSANGYTDRETQIVRDNYADHGIKGTVARLREAGYERSGESVRMKAQALGIKRDRSKMRNARAWTDEEVAIITECFPAGGSSKVREALRAKGYDRTDGAICTRASMMGLHNTNTKRRMKKSGDTRIINIVVDSSLDADIIDYLAGKHNRSDYIRRLVRSAMEEGDRE